MYDVFGVYIDGGEVKVVIFFEEIVVGCELWGMVSRCLSVGFRFVYFNGYGVCVFI